MLTTWLPPPYDYSFCAHRLIYGKSIICRKICDAAYLDFFFCFDINLLVQTYEEFHHNDCAVISALLWFMYTFV